ncbi:IclR family transcriptional regulator [Halobacterium wangiae]|uniref:IclR family transcriptional regulator n=1 Tax=Halobacterium wangiae TaxID=2902623 RepID=UPI001E3E8F24|nr:IclR family transcriptional regulator [Halobacterium wangiae]
MHEQDTFRVKSTVTTVQVIDALIVLDRPRVADIAVHLDIPKSTAHDHLSTLIGLGLVVKEPDGYRLGARFLEYGGYVRDQMAVYRAARPVVDRLAEDTGERANLLIEERGLGVYLYEAEGRYPIELDTRPGKRVPLQTTASGKAIIAHLPRSRTTEIIDEHGLPEVTGKTITERDELFTELEQIQDQGYAIDDGERVKGVRCVAAPILDHDDKVAGAVSVSLPETRASEHPVANEIVRRVLGAAEGIKATMARS